MVWPVSGNAFSVVMKGVLLAVTSPTGFPFETVPVEDRPENRAGQFTSAFISDAIFFFKHIAGGCGDHGHGIEKRCINAYESEDSEECAPGIADHVFVSDFKNSGVFVIPGTKPFKIGLSARSPDSVLSML